ncbi:MAG: hypothetical protein ACOCR1_05305 [Planctomycetota bacterium]
MNEADFDAAGYLEHCSSSELISLEDLAFWGVISVLIMAGLDLMLTMGKISTGPFVDANPLAQMFIEHGVEWGLVLFKVGSATFFAWICLANLHLPITQIGVGIATLAHLLLTFHWTLIA